MESESSLGVGSSSSSDTDNTTTSSSMENYESMNMDSAFVFQPDNEKVDTELRLCTWSSKSDNTSVYPSSSLLEFGTSMPPAARDAIKPDEGSSCYRRTGVTSQNEETNSLFDQGPRTYPTPVVSNLSKSPVASNSGITQQQQPNHCNSSSKFCQVEGCGKRARGASSRCISHRGNRRCQKPGCHKNAERRTVYCKAHEVGWRRQFLGCTITARGRTDYCIAHGGWIRYSHYDCTGVAREESGLCIRHGGGKICQQR